MEDVELLAMNSIWTALSSLPDDAARMRCIHWATSRLGIAPQVVSNIVNTKNRSAVGTSSTANSSSGAQNTQQGAPVGGGLEDIVEQIEGGGFRVIARDLKAKSRNEAAIRLVHLVLYANEVLNGQQKTSSKALVLPVLQEWRAYDGNTRGAIANHPGIKREGDSLSLDLHSRRDAEKFIAEIRDETVQGGWSPAKQKNRKSSKKSEDSASNA